VCVLGLHPLGAKWKADRGAPEACSARTSVNRRLPAARLFGKVGLKFYGTVNATLRGAASVSVSVQGLGHRHDDGDLDSGGRRPKSAKARSGRKFGTRLSGPLWGSNLRWSINGRSARLGRARSPSAGRQRIGRKTRSVARSCQHCKTCDRKSAMWQNVPVETTT
jgi:hypothetical protein